MLGGTGQELATKMVGLSIEKEGVTSVIVGARKEEQLVDNLKSVDIALSAEEMARLDKVSQLAPEYPHWLPPLQRGQDAFSRFTDVS